MNDDQLLFRELRSLLQGESGQRRFCGAVLGRGPALLANENALRIAIMAVMPYRLYLVTDHWRHVASEAKQRAHNRCQLCNSPDNIQAHHRTYERRGCELPEDLTVLCADCHGKFHTKPTPDDCVEPAASDLIDMQMAGMTEKEQMECLTEMIRRKRISQGIKEDGTATVLNENQERLISLTLARSLKSSRACSSTQKR